MGLAVRFRPEARVEVLEAWSWYEDQRPGLGGEFAERVEAAVESAADQPDAWARVFGDVRRVLIRRFPYVLFYVVEGEELLVLAVAHGRREPGSWVSRWRH